jgi:hypothetical protein
MKRTILTLAAIATLFASVAACSPRDVGSYACLDTGKTVYDVPATHPTPFPDYNLLLPDGSAVDARGETFVNDRLDSGGWSQGMKYHERTSSRRGLCLVGGVISTNFDPENTAWVTWHRITGLHVEIDDFTIVGTTLRNQGDGIAFVNADNWKVIGVRVDGGGIWPGGGYIHDDCVENDSMATGLIDDSKFDGCNVFLSSDSGGFGDDNTVQVTNSLVRLQPYRNNYNTAKYGENTHGGFFKFRPVDPTDGSRPPHLVIKNTVFRSDTRASFGGNPSGYLGLPAGTECDNVMLVGSAAWTVADRASWQNQCTNLTYGTIADWNARVADWDATHPVL